MSAYREAGRKVACTLVADLERRIALSVERRKGVQPDRTERRALLVALATAAYELGAAHAERVHDDLEGHTIKAREACDE